MTYLALSAVFLAIAIVAAVFLGRGVRRPRLAAIAIAAAIVLTLTAVFDTAMIAAGLFTYAEEHIVGLRIGLAPIEDFTYPLAALILLPVLWARLRRRHDH